MARIDAKSDLINFQIDKALQNIRLVNLDSQNLRGDLRTMAHQACSLRADRDRLKKKVANLAQQQEERLASTQHRANTLISELKEENLRLQIKCESLTKQKSKLKKLRRNS